MEALRMGRHSCDRCGDWITSYQYSIYGAEIRYLERDKPTQRPRGYTVKICKLCSNCKKQLKQFMLGKEIESLNIIRNEEDKSDNDNYF